jgi:hypothetical protein
LEKFFRHFIYRWEMGREGPRKVGSHDD